jgi:hypothetical protein
LFILSRSCEGTKRVQIWELEDPARTIVYDLNEIVAPSSYDLILNKSLMWALTHNRPAFAEIFFGNGAQSHRLRADVVHIIGELVNESKEDASQENLKSSMGTFFKTVRELYVMTLKDQNSHLRRVLEINVADLEDTRIADWVKTERGKQFPANKKGVDELEAPGAKDDFFIFSEYVFFLSLSLGILIIKLVCAAATTPLCC